MVKHLTNTSNSEASLEREGYVYENTSHCIYCGLEIAWYRNTDGKRVPFEEGTLERHRCGRSTRG